MSMPMRSVSIASSLTSAMQRVDRQRAGGRAPLTQLQWAFSDPQIAYEQAESGFGRRTPNINHSRGSPHLL